MNSKAYKYKEIHETCLNVLWVLKCTCMKLNLFYSLKTMQRNSIEFKRIQENTKELTEFEIIQGIKKIKGIQINSKAFKTFQRNSREFKRIQGN